MEYTTQDDGSIAKTEVLTPEQAKQLLLDHQASIDGARASIVDYTVRKEAEIAEHQAVIDALTPAVDAADVIVAASLATIAG